METATAKKEVVRTAQTGPHIRNTDCGSALADCHVASRLSASSSVVSSLLVIYAQYYLPDSYYYAECDCTARDIQSEASRHSATRQLVW